MTYKYSDCCGVLLIDTEVCPWCRKHCTSMVRCPDCKDVPRYIGIKNEICTTCSGKRRVAAALGGNDGAVI